LPFRSKDLVDVVELRVEADEARYLASTSRDRAAVADLLKYAAALERDATRWEEAHRNSGGASIADCLYSWLRVFAFDGQRSH
jgi:hypothetical protein